jgi:hypothetical protein
VGASVGGEVGATVVGGSVGATVVVVGSGKALATTSFTVAPGSTSTLWLGFCEITRPSFGSPKGTDWVLMSESKFS